MGVAGVEETDGAEQTGEAEEHVGAVAEVEGVGGRGAGEAIDVGDAVEVVWGGAAAARKSNIVKASGATILAAIQALSFRIRMYPV